MFRENSLYKGLVVMICREIYNRLGMIGMKCMGRGGEGESLEGRIDLIFKVLGYILRI